MFIRSELILKIPNRLFLCNITFFIKEKLRHLAAKRNLDDYSSHTNLDFQNNAQRINPTDFEKKIGVDPKT